MKIASKSFTLSATALGLVLMLGMASAAQAADAIPAPPLAAPALAVSPNAPAPAAPPAAMAPLPMPEAMAATAAPAGGSGLSPAARSKSINVLEDKVSDSVKNVVKQLSTVDNVNLDDLNTARQAVVKLEMLIDIEKHLAELDKIHSERSNDKTLAAAIPASALGLPNPSSSMPPAFELPKHSSSSSHMSDIGLPSRSSESHAEVSRISGVEGHYTATIQGKSYQVGDTLPDGNKVIAIAARMVTVKPNDGNAKELKVKGVDQVFGGSL